MPEDPWKRTERRVAEWIGGRRVPVSGRQEAGVDIDHPCLAVEVKHRDALPQWLQHAMAQAVAATSMPGHRVKIPVVFLHEAGEWHGDDWACLRMQDFVAFLAWLMDDNQGADDD